MAELQRPGSGGGESTSSPVTLREYVDQAIANVDKTIASAIESQDRALTELEKLFLSQIAAMKEATATAMTAAEKAINTAMVEREKAVNAALAASDKAVGKAEQSQQNVNASQNEFRQQLKDQAASFVTIASHDALDRRIQGLEKTFVTKDTFEALDRRLQTTERTLVPSDRFEERVLSHAKDDDSKHSQLDNRITAIENSRATLLGRSSVTAVLWAAFTSVIVGLIVAFVFYSITHR